MSAPKQTGAEIMWIGGLGPRMFWGTRVTNFFIKWLMLEAGIGAGPVSCKTVRLLQQRHDYEYKPVEVGF